MAQNRIIESAATKIVAPLALKMEFMETIKSFHIPIQNKTVGAYHRISVDDSQTGEGLQNYYYDGMPISKRLCVAA